MKKAVIYLLVAILCFGTFAGCNDGTTSGSSTQSSAGTSNAEDTAAGLSDSNKEYKIGCSFDYLSDFMTYMTDGVTAYDTEHDNVSVTVQDANFDVSEQLKQVENFINAGYDAIIIKPVDTEGCVPISNACQEAGVPLVVVCTGISSAYDCYVGSDHKLSGTLQGEFVAEQLNGKGKIAILQGELSLAATQERTDGNLEVFDQYPDIEVVSMQVAEWMRDVAMKKTENWLNSGIEIDAIVANSDEMALGAALALKEAGITDVLVCGIDASEEALRAMNEGILHMTVFQDGYQQGYKGVENAIKILNGETVPEYVDVPYVPVLPEQADEYLEKIAQ